jgi:uncharacterized membrane protein
MNKSLYTLAALIAIFIGWCILNIEEHHFTVAHLDTISGVHSTYSNMSNSALNALFMKGINTAHGIIKLHKTPLTTRTIITVNGNTIIDSPRAITLIRYWPIYGNGSLLLLSYTGDINCPIEYQLIETNYHIITSSLFGNCLLLKNITENNDGLVLLMSNNSIDNQLLEYHYINSVLSQSNKAALKNAAQIIALAKQEKCYIAGTFLDNSACNNGKKYCTMFSNNILHEQNNAASILQEFCKQ